MIMSKLIISKKNNIFEITKYIITLSKKLSFNTPPSFKTLFLTPWLKKT